MLTLKEIVMLVMVDYRQLVERVRGERAGGFLKKIKIFLYRVWGEFYI